MPARLIAGNWKMNRGGHDGTLLARAVVRALPEAAGALVVVCPPFTVLQAVRAELGGAAALGAQDCHWEPAGAFTGAVAAGMLADLGCSYVIVGHSERRHGLGETDGMVAGKVRAALGAGLRPILCVGETAAERDAGTTEARVAAQVSSAFHALAAAERARCVVAYEPVWAIGSGRTPTPGDTAAVARLIRGTAGGDVPVLYGGSVTAANCTSFWSGGGCDGALVGGASLDPDAFGAIVAAAAR